MKDVKQNINDLIYNVSLFGSDVFNLSIPYVDNGIYDRITKNFLENKGNDFLQGNDEWGWVKVYSKFYKNLIKPSMKDSSNNNTSYSGWNFGDIKYGTKMKYKGIIKLRKYFYKSVKQEGYTAVTFGDSNRVIQPFKILNHKFSNIVDGVVKKEFYCKKCGIKSWDGKIPIELLDCDEFVMKDIII